MNQTEPHDISELIRHCRKWNHLTQNQLAELAGVGKTVVFDIEKGKETVQFNSLKKILDVLNIKLKFEPPFPIEREINS